MQPEKKRADRSILFPGTLTRLTEIQNIILDNGTGFLHGLDMLQKISLDGPSCICLPITGRRSTVRIRKWG